MKYKNKKKYHKKFSCKKIESEFSLEEWIRESTMSLTAFGVLLGATGIFSSDDDNKFNKILSGLLLFLAIQVWSVVCKDFKIEMKLNLRYAKHFLIKMVFNVTNIVLWLWWFSLHLEISKFILTYYCFLALPSIIAPFLNKIKTIGIKKNISDLFIILLFISLYIFIYIFPEQFNTTINTVHQIISS